MKCITKILCCLCILTYSIVNGQVVISPTASANPFFTLEQMLSVQLMNAGETSLNGILQVQMEDSYTNAIFQMQSLPIELKKGQILSGRQIEWENGLRFGQNQIAQLMAGRNGLPTGQYIYCYRFINGQSSRSIGNYCQESTFQPFQKPRLIYPNDQQQIDTRFPILNWHPPLPLFSNQVNYTLRLVELEENQSPIEAINTNIPLLERFRLKNLSIPYPSSGIALEKEKKYVWQITAFWMDSEIGKTEIWEFSLADETVEKIPKPTEAFRMVKRKLDGSHYEFKNQIYLAYHNRAYDEFLDFTIYEEGKKQLPKSTKVKPIALKTGVNEITLNPKDYKLRKGKKYLLEIVDNRGQKHYLKFKYAKRK